VRLAIAVAFTLVVGTAPFAGGQTPSRPPSQPPRGLATEAIAGEAVALLPLTLVVTDPAVRADSALTILGDRRHLLLWADSVISEEFETRAPEVKWVSAPRLRQMAHRNPGMVPDPDQMGQAILRSPKLSKVPDPLRGSLRNLTAITGGRYAMVPAAMGLSRDPGGGFRADLSLALADSRSGAVLWRSATYGSGAAPGDAIAAAIAAILPPPTTGP
jgi:hypothetical protein